jgi:hypothetical protein
VAVRRVEVAEGNGVAPLYARASSGSSMVMVMHPALAGAEQVKCAVVVVAYSSSVYKAWATSLQWATLKKGAKFLSWVTNHGPVTEKGTSPVGYDVTTLGSRSMVKCQGGAGDVLGLVLGDGVALGLSDALGVKEGEGVGDMVGVEASHVKISRAAPFSSPTVASTHTPAGMFTYKGSEEAPN